MDRVSRDSTDLSGTMSRPHNVVFFSFLLPFFFSLISPSPISPFPSPISHLPYPHLPSPLSSLCNCCCCVCSFPQNSTDGIRVSLRQIIAEQNRFRVREARHRYTADSNLILVTGFSFVNLLVMVTAAVTQVVVLRRLFKEYRKDRIKT